MFDDAQVVLELGYSHPYLINNKFTINETPEGFRVRWRDFLTVAQEVYFQSHQEALIFSMIKKETSKFVSEWEYKEGNKFWEDFDE